MRYFHTMLSLLNTTFCLLLLFFPSALMGQIRDPRSVNQEWKTDIKSTEVELGEFLCLLKRDGIPPIDHPEFVPAKEALLKGITLEPVIVFERNGEARAYPLSILMYHEIVNDEVGGLAVTITYCPLCNASIVFDRNLEVHGQPLLLDFGVSGMLRNSDLVMWDRQTESWWQQLTGRALVGELAGEELTILPSKITSLQDFVQYYPTGKVLYSSEEHNYGTNPYVHYDSLGKAPFLFEPEPDSRLEPNEYVINLYGQRIPRVYPLRVLREKGLIQEQYEGKAILLLYASGMLSVMDEREISESRDMGSVTVFDPGEDQFELIEGAIRDQKTNSEWNNQGICISGKRIGEQLTPLAYGTHFAFAWLHFHPHSTIYKP